MAGNCRFCQQPLSRSMVDLGMSPLSNTYLDSDHLYQMEPYYPLHVFICEACFLAQLEEFETPEAIFGDYAYFSSYSDSWVAHAKDYASKMVARFGFDSSSQVVEIASNDGYLLQFFKQREIPVLGIEPAANVAAEAEKIGIPSLVRFFGTELAREMVADGRMADLLLGNNVLAHVPNLNDFVAGMKIVLSHSGIITMEFPHLLRLIQEVQFDTIYHEHFSYFSLSTVEQVFARHQLRIFDVENLSTHGGSLRIYACHSENGERPTEASVEELKASEEMAGLNRMETYDDFAEKVREVKRGLLEFLIKAKRDGYSVVGYGAPAKGNTLLNYCGVGPDFIDYTVDRSPHKQGRFLPGTHIPIHAPEMIGETRPDYVLILPWNLKEEITEQMEHISTWGGRFVIPIPSLELIS